MDKIRQLLDSAVRNRQSGNLAGAAQAYREVLQLVPDNVQVLQALAQVCYEQGELEEATGVLQKACTLQPDAPDMRYSLAVLLASTGKQDEATRHYQEILRQHPDHVASRVAMGVEYLQGFDFSAAIDCFESAIGFDANNAAASYNLGLAKMRVGQGPAADECFARALASRPGFPEAQTCQLFNLHNLSGITGQQLFEAHTGWARQFSGLATGAATRESGPPDRPIRVGYVSPDFRRHSVAYFIAPVLAAHHRDRVESFCYASVDRPDTVTRRIRGVADHWRDIYRLDDDQAADLVREDGIDILVDLSGHTSGHRLALFARKPAPIQVSWIGYPGTTGLSAMDYRITDNRADPEGESDRYHTEKLVRLDACFLCYEPEDRSGQADRAGATPAACNGYVTFGSFNNLSKYTPETLALWSEILRQCPGSRLLLKAKGLGDRLGKEGVYAEFRKHGIEPDRVETLGHLEDAAQHLDLYNRVDIALDTFPYNGTTTSCEALWMGVPVVSLAGSRHASRVGDSLLTAIGLPGYAAKTANDYVSMAVNLARDVAELESLHGSLREKMQSSSLMDAPRLVNNLENIFRSMLEV